MVMKKTIAFTCTLLFALLLSACNDDMTLTEPDEIYEIAVADYSIDAEPLEWGEITHFSMDWGCFHSGDRFFHIAKRDGQYLLNAYGCGEIVMFVPEWHPIDVSEVEKIQYILQANDIDRWNGYRRTWCEMTTSSWGFRLSFELDTGSAFSMSSMTAIPMEFREIFQALTDALLDLEELYTFEPEWGNLQSVTFTRNYIGQQLAFVRRTVFLRYNTAPFIMRYNTTLFAVGTDLSDAVEVGPGVLQELHQLMIEHGIDQWWWDEYRRNIERGRPQETRWGTWTQIHVGFDNGTGFLHTRSAPRECAAVNALLEFFEELERQVQQNSY